MGCWTGSVVAPPDVLGILHFDGLKRYSERGPILSQDNGCAMRPKNAIEGRVKCSDDRGVANLGHHARHHVVEIVAVKRPAAGIVGVKGDGDAAHWWHKDGIAYGAC